MFKTCHRIDHDQLCYYSGYIYLQGAQIMIRQMVSDDIEALTSIGAAMHLESSYRHTEYSADKCRALGGNILANPRLVGLVSEINGEINGFFIVV